MKRGLLLPLLLLAAIAYAGISIDKNPPGLRPGQQSSLSALRKPVLAVNAGRPWTAPRPAHDRFAWSAPLAAAAALDLDGQETELALSEGQDLADPLSLPLDAVAVRVWLSGPLTLSPVKEPGRILRALELDTLEIPLVEPGAEQVVFELTEAPLLELLDLDDATLARRLLDGVQASPR